MKIINIFLILQLLLVCNKSLALSEPRPLAVDKRLQVMVYNPEEVFKFTGFYGYESSLVFESGEVVNNITMGDSTAWQIVPNGNRIFIKPIENDATTNMTVITSKRVYHFELHGDYAENINDPRLIFSIKFLYPDENDNSNSAIENYGNEAELEFDDSKLNYNYTVSGLNSVLPVKVFDDGKKTYFQFDEKNNEIPAIFMVYQDGTEGLINFTIKGNYIVVERINSKFTLRRGQEVGCVFNESIK